MPVRSTIHSSVVSTSVESSSFVRTRSGTWQPSPVIEIGRPFGADAITSPGSTAKVSVPRTASSPSTVAVHLAAADRAAHRLDVALERQRLAGPHDALEAHVVDAREERELAAVLGLREHGDRAALRERLDHLHAGHDRVAGEVAGAVLVGHGLARDDALARHELEHLVEQEQRVAVRQDRLDLRPVHRRRRSRREPLPQPVPPAVRVALRRADRQPGRAEISSNDDVERVLEHDDGRLRRRQLGEAGAELAPCLGGRERAAGSPSRGHAAVLDERLRAAPAAQRACATSLQVLTTSRWSQVENCDSPRNWPTRCTSFTSDSCAASRASSGSRSTWSASRWTRSDVPRAERVERKCVTVFRAPDENGVARASRRRAARWAAVHARLDGSGGREVARGGLL